MLWILALAKARSVAPISIAISAKRATKANAKINATVDGASQKGDWLRRSVVAAHCGDAPPSFLAIRPSDSTRDLSQYFNRLLATYVFSADGAASSAASGSAPGIICGHFISAESATHSGAHRCAINGEPVG